MDGTGKLTDWNDKKGFGFITPAGGGPRVFVHVSAFPRGRRPSLHSLVAYTVVQDKQKRLRAERVSFSDSSSGRPSVAPGVSWALGTFAVFFAGLAVLVVLGSIPLVIVGGFALASVVSFGLYRHDKNAARASHQRIPETTLHLFDLVGGWPGALVAQQLYRHKTAKQPFQVIFWCAVVIHCAGLVWLTYAQQAASVRAMLGFG